MSIINGFLERILRTFQLVFVCNYFSTLAYIDTKLGIFHFINLQEQFQFLSLGFSFKTKTVSIALTNVVLNSIVTVFFKSNEKIASS